MAVYIKSPDKYVFGPDRPEFTWPKTGDSEYAEYLYYRDISAWSHYQSNSFVFIDEEDMPTVGTPLDRSRENRQRSYSTVRALWEGSDKD